MAKRKSVLEPKPALITPVATPPEIRPGDKSFIGLLDTLAALVEQNSEKEREARIAEGERQLEIVAAQIQAQQKWELARRAECRRIRLEREAKEKAAAEAESGPKYRRKGKIPVQTGA